MLARAAEFVIADANGGISVSVMFAGKSTTASRPETSPESLTSAPSMRTVPTPRQSFATVIAVVLSNATTPPSSTTSPMPRPVAAETARVDHATSVPPVYVLLPASFKTPSER